MAYRASTILHHQTCPLHDNEGSTTCSGTLKKGGKCANKATGLQVARMLPTCKIHRDQLKVLGCCQAPLSCGFECGRLFEWKPHGFQLCPGHRECTTTCYFLKIPTEMRLRVYRFLLPDRPIPARYGNSRNLTTDGEGVYTAILRINHQIHDEAVDLLYGTRVFTIELSGNGLGMCNLGNTFVRNMFPSRGNHALQDYQMQLMQLEQQNKRRLLLARQEQDGITAGSSSTRPPAIRGIQLPTTSAIPCTYKLAGPIWHPKLSERYFNMIRSFLIELVYPASGLQRSGLQSSVTYNTHGLLNVDATNRQTLELRLYDYCDCLHALVGRLQLIQRPITHVQVVIKFGNTYIERSEAFSAAQLLLQPLRRLRNVANLELLSVTMSDFRDREIELLIPDEIFDVANETFADFVKCWSSNLCSSEPSLECPQVFEAYWQLEKLLASIKERYNYMDPKFSQFTDLLHDARIAREAENLAGFREIWNQVVNIWSDHLNSQEDFQSNVASSIGAIYDIVGN
jgi:hypothetical protein